MKTRPTSDYPVRVVFQPDEVHESLARYYEGIYTVILNHTVDIAFVPDVSATAPPWDGHRLPAELDDVSTVEQARIEMVLLSAYAVTPHPRLAGEVERVPEFPPPSAAQPPTPPEQRRGWVRYVEPRQFDRFAAELPRFHEVVANRLSGATVSGLLDFEVMRFIADEIVAAPWLHPRDATLLGRGLT